ncbi:hypothetical protein K501DRAFT_209653 [Backusella circina FSU 941]|nr:hypothetical protein K501DRAFT_209653 [Backusella circina FSU 941]
MLGDTEQYRASGVYGYLIGIDFGTTFTGACFAPFHDSKSKPEIVSVDIWPRHQTYGYPKTPTILLYKKNEDGYTIDKWGKAAEKLKHKAVDDKLFFSLFKLLLDKDSGVENRYRHQFPTKRLIADYLRHVDQYIKKIIKNQNPKAIQEHCYCITVPAMWDDSAKSIMREAAMEAGMIKASDEPGRLILTSEPEAAALECERMNIKGSAIEDHETIIICDAGGGTIDLTVYQVVIEGDKKYFEELTRGHGKSCGSSYIDDLAKLWIRGHLDQCAQHFTEYALDAMVEDFRDKLKINVDGEDDDDIYIELHGTIKLNPSGVPDYIEENNLKITSQQMLEYIFDPVVDQVLALIDEQLARIPGIRPDKLFLVGGFGQSEYLLKRIKEEFLESGRVGNLFVPPNGALAIAKGAVLYGLNPSIITHRVARRSYGVRCNKKFRDGIDDPNNLLLGLDGQRRCKNRLDFFVTKNTKIASSHFIEREYFAFYPQNTNSVLYSYNGEDDSLPDYVYSQGAEEVSRFNIKMPMIPGKKDGDKIAYKTRIYLGLTEIRFEVQIAGETQVHRVNISDQPLNTLTDNGTNTPGYDGIVTYFHQQGFATDQYPGQVQAGRGINSVYLHDSLTNWRPEI